MDVGIVAIGTAVPNYKRNQLETAELIATSLNLAPAKRRLLKSVYKATGIDHRYSVMSDYGKNAGDLDFFPNDPEAPFPSTAKRMQLYKEEALNLSLKAIQNCFENITAQPQVTHLIQVSCTGMYAPGVDIELIHKLKLSSSTKRTAIQFMGCYGAFNALKIAESICKAEKNAEVLIICVELCTIHFQKEMKLDNMISNAIFADGAAAVIVKANPPHQKYLNLTSFHCDLLPQASKDMAWHIADHGFDIVLSTYVPEAIASGIYHFVQRLLEQNNLFFSNIHYYAIHPGGLKILEACEAALKITKEDNKYAYHVLKNFGNMSSPTILFVLKSIWDELNTTDHQKTIFGCAFGPGLTLESMLLSVHHV